MPIPLSALPIDAALPNLVRVQALLAGRPDHGDGNAPYEAMNCGARVPGRVALRGRSGMAVAIRARTFAGQGP